MPPKDLILLGVVLGPQGLQGQLKVKSFTAEPADIAAYGPLVDGQGRRVDLQVVGTSKGQVLARIKGVGDRTAAEALKGAKLFIARSALPPPEDEAYYHADLIGLRAEDQAGQALGQVVGVENFGAGDLLEIEDQTGARHLLPFTQEVVPQVDIAAGRLCLVWPEEIVPPQGSEKG